MNVEESESPKPRIQNLQFINLTDEPKNQKGDFAVAVRSHARRSFVYRKRNSKLSATRIQTPRPRLGPGSEDGIEDPQKLQGKFKLDTWSTKPRKKAVRDLGEERGIPAPLVRY